MTEVCCLTLHHQKHNSPRNHCRGKWNLLTPLSPYGGWNEKLFYPLFWDFDYIWEDVALHIHQHKYPSEPSLPLNFPLRSRNEYFELLFQYFWLWPRNQSTITETIKKIKPKRPCNMVWLHKFDSNMRYLLEAEETC